MSFKKVTPNVKGKILGIPAIRFKKKEIFFNVQTVREFFTEKKSKEKETKFLNAVEIYVDSEKKKVGFIPQKKISEDRFRVRIYRPKKSPVGAVYAPSVLNEINQWVGEKKTFPLEEKEGMLVATVKS